MYGMMYGMKKTTLYLPDELKDEIAIVARQCGVSEAEFMRSALAESVRHRVRPKPRAGLFESDDPHLSERVDELLEGFGER